MEAPIYTSCVQPKDFSGVGFKPKYFTGEIGFALYFFITLGIPGLFGTVVAAMAALHKVCDFLLHGRLVCLDGAGCALGRVLSFETVDEKSGFDKIDNDFSFNILLAPLDLEFFAKGNFDQDVEKEFKNRYEEAKKKPQGHLISEQPGMPKPLEPKDGQRYCPTYTEYPDRNNVDYAKAPKGTSTAAGGSAPFRVPVLHCEIEGNRTHMVCDALDLPLYILGKSKLCRWKPLGIPIGRFVCATLSVGFAPVIAAAVAIAWLAGSDDNRRFEGAGRLVPGDEVIVKGRWIYDAAHQGWNEIHPVTEVQRTSELGPSRPLEEWRQIWCESMNWAPPTPPLPPRFISKKSMSLTAKQEAVYDSQCRPENRWVLHPAVDGCEESSDDDSIGLTPRVN